MITSMSNPQIKYIQQLLKKTKVRREAGLFVVEGWKMFREAPKERIEKVYASASFIEENAALLKEKGCLPGTERCQEIEDRIFKALSDTVTPQGILCLIKQREYTLDTLLEEKEGKKPLLMILENLQDPGNLGTIIRTGEGAGVSGVILNKGCVDLYNPKVIRSTMGSVYRVPVVMSDSIQEEVLPVLREKKIRTYAAHLKGINNYDREDFTRGTAFFIGNEGNGLTEDLTSAADCLIKIPMEGEVESLNAAMAAGILMYETARQRRK